MTISSSFTLGATTVNAIKEADSIDSALIFGVNRGVTVPNCEPCQ
jgi:hypothetical protein